MGASNVVELQHVVPEQTRIDRARYRNKKIALALAAAGIPILFCNPETKRPYTPRFQKLDTDMTAEERESARREFYDAHKFDPLNIGCTVTRSTVRAVLRAKPDAIPAISCGPAGLIVVDNDIKERNGVLRNGVDLFDGFCEPHGGIPSGAIVVQSQGKGRHVYFANPEGRGNSGGVLKKQCETDVKGVGGYVIAPGVERPHDGRAYGTRADLDALIAARSKGRLATLPAFIADAIGARNEAYDSSTNERDTQSLADRLMQADLPDAGDLLEPTFGGIDFARLVARYSKLGEAIGSGDRSDVRFNLAVALKTDRPQTTAEEFAAIVLEREECGTFVDDDKPSQGEFSWRNIARDWSRATPSKAGKTSEGEAFGAVDDEGETDEDDEGEAAPVSKAERQAKRFVYIENIRGAVARALDWCIKFFVARGTTSVATGLWGAGKTAVFSDIGLHVGHGFEWRGRKTKKGVVIYVALENSDDVERRVATWCDLMERAGRDLSGGAFVVHRGPCRLFDPSGKPTRDEKDLIEIANTAARHYGLPVAMIVIDTLAQSIMPGNDNDAKDAGIYTAAMQRIVAATGANVTALAHPTKSGAGVRGSGALQANVDTVIEVSRDSGGRGTIQAGTKFRIGNPSKVRFGYRLRSHTIGHDEDGDDIDVVLAVEDHSGVDMAVEDTDDDDAAPQIVQPDRREDRIRAVVDVFEIEAVRQKAADESVVSVRQRLELQSGEICAAVNKRRRVDGLEPLGRSTIRDHIASAVESGDLEAVGTAARPAYKLA